MKKRILAIILILMLFSCTEDISDQLICDSNNILCKFFEIKHPKISFITEDNAQLSLEDINTYTQLSDQYKKDNSYKSIFDLYTGIFIPRFSYNLLDSNSMEKLWFGLALYPGDQSQNIEIITDSFYNNDAFSAQTKSIYGECIKDSNSYLSTEKSIIYNCKNNEIKSYDYWTSDDEFIWRMICVWQKDEFEAVNQGKLLVETVKSSDTCRESFKSFKSKLE